MATTVTCDRCDTAIRLPSARFAIKPPTRCNPSSTDLEPRVFDLCERCAKRFADWINPPMSASEDTDVRSQFPAVDHVTFAAVRAAERRRNGLGA